MSTTPPYTLHSKISTDAGIETWRGLNANGVDSIIRISVNPDDFYADGSTCLVIREKVREKKLEFGNYFPSNITWNSGYVIHEMPASAMSLSEVSKAFAHDIPLADAAWMINRFLEAIHLVHATDHIHANLTPDTFFIVPETHEGKLIGFENSIAHVIGGVTAYNTWHVNPDWTSLYPAEYIAKETYISPSMDVYMAAAVIGTLLPMHPDDTPEELTRLLKACQLGPKARIQTVQELHEDFNKIIKAQFGKRKFRPLIFP